MLCGVESIEHFNFVNCDMVQSYPNKRRSQRQRKLQPLASPTRVASPTNAGARAYTAPKLVEGPQHQLELAHVAVRLGQPRRVAHHPQVHQHVPVRAQVARGVTARRACEEKGAQQAAATARKPAATRDISSRHSHERASAHRRRPHTLPHTCSRPTRTRRSRASGGSSPARSQARRPPPCACEPTSTQYEAMSLPRLRCRCVCVRRPVCQSPPLSLVSVSVCFSVYSLSPGPRKIALFHRWDPCQTYHSLSVRAPSPVDLPPSLSACICLSVCPSVRWCLFLRLPHLSYHPPHPSPPTISAIPPPPAPLAPEAGGDVVWALEDDVLRARGDDARRHRLSRTPRRARPGPSRVCQRLDRPDPSAFSHLVGKLDGNNCRLTRPPRFLGTQRKQDRPVHEFASSGRVKSTPARHILTRSLAVRPDIACLCKDQILAIRGFIQATTQHARTHACRHANTNPHTHTVSHTITTTHQILTGLTRTSPIVGRTWRHTSHTRATSPP